MKATISEKTIKCGSYSGRLLMGAPQKVVRPLIQSIYVENIQIFF